MLRCKVESCSNAPAHVGLCNNHYRRQLAYGTPDMVADLRTGPREQPYCWVGVPSQVGGRRGASGNIGRLRLYPARSAQHAWEMLLEVRESQDERGVCIAGDLSDLGVRREVSFAEFHAGPMRLEETE